ncbi:MAG: hypothetical protein AAF641_03190 [Pseudomonadota bacterium]
MHDLFSSFFGPGGDGDRVFAWLWPLTVLGYLIGFGLFGAPTLWGFEVDRFSKLFMLSCAFGTATVMSLFGLGALITWILAKFEK